MKREKIKDGRPTKYSDEIADIICNKIATSNRGLVTLLKEDDRLPAFSTVFKWLGEEDKQYFIDKYNEAKIQQADYLADEIIGIADDGTNDYAFKEGEDADGEGAKPFVLKEHIQRSRLRVDARKWIASKLKPKKWGDKSEVDITTKGESINKITVEIITKPQE